MSSPILLVPCAQPPLAQWSSSIYHAQPAGPGLPSAEPSAAAMISCVLFTVPSFCAAALSCGRQSVMMSVTTLPHRRQGCVACGHGCGQPQCGLVAPIALMPGGYTKPMSYSAPETPSAQRPERPTARPSERVQIFALPTRTMYGSLRFSWSELPGACRAAACGAVADLHGGGQLPEHSGAHACHGGGSSGCAVQCRF